MEDRDVKQVVCEELCVTKLHMKDGALQRKGPFARSERKIGSTAIFTRKCHTRMSQALPSPQCHQKNFT